MPRTDNRLEHRGGCTDRSARRRAILALAGCLAAVPCTTVAADLGPGRPVEVRILLDGSGSMWPGYDPAGGGLTRSVAGEEFYWDSAWFTLWLDDFVRAQEVLGAESVSLSLARSDSGFFQGGDLDPLWPSRPPIAFDAADALAPIEGWGRYTHLGSALDRFTEGFTGLAWLITDNVVETGRGEPDQEVVEFFNRLKEDEKYRSVHLFKLPAPAVTRRAGREPALAVYGLVISPRDLDGTVKAHYDRILRERFRDRSRPGGRGDLFPQRQHRKLKDLSVDALELEIREKLRVDIGSPGGVARENRVHEFLIPCRIKSNLTQHSVIGGQYRLRVSSPFVPDEESREAFGLERLELSSFSGAAGTLSHRLPPGGSRELDLRLSTNRPLGLDLGPLGWLKAAIFGIRVEYSGDLEMSFSNVRVDLEREELIGIFGAERVPEIFDDQEVHTIALITVGEPMSFLLEGSASRGILLLLLLLLVGVPAGLVILALTRPARFRIHVGESSTDVALRRLGRYPVTHAGQRVGALQRTLGGAARFVPERGNAAVQVEPRGVNQHLATVRGQAAMITIEPLARANLQTAGKSRARGRQVGGRIRRPGEHRAAGPSIVAPPAEGSRGGGTPSGGGGGRTGPRATPKIRRP